MTVLVKLGNLKNNNVSWVRFHRHAFSVIIAVYHPFLMQFRLFRTNISILTVVTSSNYQ